MTILQRLYLCLMAVFANFQNALIFPILAAFILAVFCIEELQCLVGTFLACYSLCLVAVFANSKNALIFRILAVFFKVLLWMEQLHWLLGTLSISTTMAAFYS